MTNILVVLTCAVADGFLLYLLVQFTRELRKRRIARTLSPVTQVSIPAAEKATKGHPHRKVIDITLGRRELSQNPSRRPGFLIAGRGKG